VGVIRGNTVVPTFASFNIESELIILATQHPSLAVGFPSYAGGLSSNIANTRVPLGDAGMGFEVR
jgi:hypothetical protein